MVFTSPIFLFGFLPVVLLLYYLSPRSIKNTTLLLFSLLFYAWGEVFYLVVMIVSIVSNYFWGIQICISQKKNHSKTLQQLHVTAAVIINIALLSSFKYSNFIVDNINAISSLAGFPSIDLRPIHLPLGISFFTFQAISYIVDVYRKEIPPQGNIFHLALYICLFPQLIAGPIVRYRDVALQITSRSHSLDVFADGVRRFIYGMAKKTLVANPLGEVADAAFALTGNEMTMPLAWIGIVAYTLQIYFDFSGYSDMAIGLGRMFGLRFLENFNYPYISTSVREFWRRWHISLSTWFRDYVYFPLGGSRVPTIRVYINLTIVFILTGFWHGASWNFLIWGLFHGFFLACEHAGLSNVLNKIWKPIQHAYVLAVVIFGWVFFRADTLSQAIDYIHAMADFSNFKTSLYQFVQVLSYEAIYAFSIGAILSAPVCQLVQKYLFGTSWLNTHKIASPIGIPRLVLLSSLLLLSTLKIASSTYNPFIYFRF